MIERAPKQRKMPEVTEGSVTELQGERFAGRKFVSLTVSAPEAAQVQGRGKYTEGELSEMELIGTIADSEEAVIHDVESLEFGAASGENNDDGIMYPAHPDGNTWYLDQRTPETVRRIFKQALAHEASINPELADHKFKAHVSIRLMKPEHAEHWADPSEGLPQPHFDGNPTAKNPGVSGYIVSSAPGTIEYAPESASTRLAPEIGGEDFLKPAEEWFKREGGNQGVRATSILPMRLYHYDERMLHSTPWDNFPPSKGMKPRFLCRILFFQPD